VHRAFLKEIKRIDVYNDDMKNQVILIAGIALLLGGIGGYAISKSERYEHGFMMGGWGDWENRKDRDDDVSTNKNGTACTICTEPEAQQQSEHLFRA
jgi:hypothetical protein